MIQRLFLALICAILLTPTFGFARNVALVVGNDDYQHLPPLAVAVSDAQAHCDHLRNVRQFEVVQCHYDVSKADFDRALLDFLRQLQRGDTAMVVFSGHGVQLNPTDPKTVFLIPTDLDRADLEPGLEEFSLRQSAIQFDEVRAAVRSRDVRLSVFVLDNCRDNPLAGVSTRTLGLADGLGNVPADRGEFIFFSASEGETAFDRIEDSDANSPFTTAFLNAFQPNVPLTTVANAVERSVLLATRQAGLQPQRPRYDDNVEGPGCIEGVGLCNGQALAVNVDLEVNNALRSLELAALQEVLPKLANHPRRKEVQTQIEIHQTIDRQHSLLEISVLKELYARLIRHPRREEVRGLIRRAILFDACNDLQRYGWDCPQTPNPEVKKAPEAQKKATPEEGSTVASLSDGAEVTPKASEQSDYENLLMQVDASTLSNFTLPLKNVQEALFALGHYTGRADGQFGPRTAAAQTSWRAAISSPQTAQRLTSAEQVILLVQAAEASPVSKALLGLFVAQGIGLKQDADKGRALLNEAIDEGFSDARAWLDALEQL